MDEIKFDTVLVGDEIAILAESYLAQGVLPPKCKEDALHIAAATIYKCHAIVSWNFKHIVKLRTFIGVNGINKLMGYGEIALMSPYEVSVEEENV